MYCFEKNEFELDNEAQHATSKGFCRIFAEHMDALYQLSFLLTASHDEAEQCFLAGLEDCIQDNLVFRGDALSWAKGAIIQNAIRALHSRLDPANGASTLVLERSNQTHNFDVHFEIERVLALEDLERSVFVLTFLERYSEQECAFLLGYPLWEIHLARSRALERIANSGCTASSREADLELELTNR